MRENFLTMSGNWMLWPPTRHRQLARVTLAGLLLIAYVSQAQAVPANNQRLSDSIAYLSEHGVAISENSSADDAAKLLRPLLVDQATLEQTHRYLFDLRSDDYGKRETASRELAKLRVPIDPLLALPDGVPEPSDPANLEFNWRVQQILAVRRSLALEDQLYHALIVIQELPVSGLVAELLSTASALNGGDAALIKAAETAIGATVSAKDREFLQSVLRSDKPTSTKLRATVALSGLLAKMDQSQLTELLMSTDPDMRVAAAKGALAAGNSAGISILVQLLESSSTAIRCSAADLLFQYTGLDFGFAGYDPIRFRQASISKWNEWLASDFKDANHLPPQPGSSGRVIVGIELNEEPDAKEGRRKRDATNLRSNVIEFSPSGSIRRHLRSTDLRGGTAIAAVPLHQNGRAIAFGKPTGGLQQSISIRFFDRNNQTIGSLSGLAGMPVLGLSDSRNLLVAAANEVVEIGMAGNLVQRRAFAQLTDTIDFFSSTRGGRMIIISSSSNTIREFLRDGEMVVEENGLKHPVYARRLNDGGMIVAQQSTHAPALLRFDASGEVLWTFTPSREVGELRAAAALSNGHALFGSPTGLYEIGPGGRITRTWINGSVRFLYAD